MNIDLVSVRKSLHELIDSDDPNDDEKLNKLFKEFQDARLAKRGKTHSDDICNISLDINSTISWLKTNPPTNNENTFGYYMRYRVATKNNNFKEHTIQVVTKELKNLGYEIRRSGNKRLWIKKHNYVVKRCDDDFTPLQLVQHIQPVKYEYTYFIIEIPFTNKVKIGKAKNAEKRLKVLQTGNPNKLCLYHKLYAPALNNMESVLHKQYSARKINGEWFNFTIEELNDEIKKLNS
jgi:hypothetical protein